MSQMQTSIWAFVTRVFENRILIALVVLVVCYLLVDAWREWKRNFPPGPYGLPILGYLPFLDRDPLWDFQKLGEKYGDVFSLKMGSQTVVVLHGVEAIKEALARPEFLGRPPTGPLKLFNENSAFFMDGVQKWREQRRFLVQWMKVLGLEKTQIEGEIMDEIHYFLDKLRVHHGAPMDFKETLSPSISNNICTLVFGKRFEYEDSDRLFLDKNLEVGIEALHHAAISAFFPWLLQIPLVSNLIATKKAFQAFTNLKTFFKTMITKHRDIFETDNIRDFVDSYIYEQNSRQEKDPNTTFSDDTLVSNVLDLFAAGSEAVRTSIMFCVYVAAAFPQQQQKIKEEILEVMGSERDPEYQDLKSMPFTHSFILEVMRWKTMVPMNAPHYTLSEATIGKYYIPQNVTILFNLWNAHHDPNYWDDPESFIPDRFITKDEKSVSKPAHYMPFSMGERVCPGEPMAFIQIFLYFTSILQKFQVVFPDGYKPTFKAAMKGTYRLDPYKVRFLSKN